MTDARFSLLDTGSLMLDSRFWMLDPGWSMLDTGCRMPDAGYRMLDTRKPDATAHIVQVDNAECSDTSNAMLSALCALP